MEPFAADLYRAAVGLGDLAGYGEPEPRAAFRQDGVEPVEALEDEGNCSSGIPTPVSDRARISMSSRGFVHTPFIR